MAQWDSVATEAARQTERTVYRGALGDFPVGSSSNCTTLPAHGTALPDPVEPASSAGFWYLVQGTNACGSGSLGTWGSGSERAVPECSAP